MRAHMKKKQYASTQKKKTCHIYSTRPAAAVTLTYRA